MQALFLLAIILQAFTASAFYSIGYHTNAAHATQLINAGATFTTAPSTEQVADICARLSGLSPLLWEGKNTLLCTGIFFILIFKF